MKDISNDSVIIDSHVHITSPEIIDNIEQYRRLEPYFDLLCSSPANNNVTAAELIEHMNSVGIDKSVVFGFSFKNMDLCRKVNDYTIAMVNKYPDRLIGLAAVNPTHPKLTQELQRCRKADLKGIGELFPVGQEFEITQRDNLETLCNFCREYDWPIYVHLNEPIGHDYKGKTKDSITEGEILANNFPEITFVYAHFGGGLCFYELMPEVKKNLKNVYYDTAAAPFLYQKNIYQSLKAAGLLDKIILGSDYPLISPEVYLNRIDQTELNTDDKEFIYNKNIYNILGKAAVISK